mmetsp:Transcript_11507/g.25782  ORF Transcript_11507/g.25782 Transcript_11507/m.25782 type:complete len:138 (+) Transcript_11507:1480-1893(+)
MSASPFMPRLNPEANPVRQQLLLLTKTAANLGDASAKEVDMSDKKGVEMSKRRPMRLSGRDRYYYLLIQLGDMALCKLQSGDELIRLAAVVGNLASSSLVLLPQLGHHSLEGAGLLLRHMSRLKVRFGVRLYRKHSP